MTRTAGGTLLAEVRQLLALIDPPPAVLVPGDVLGDRFRIVREIGRGGMGSVFLAEDRQSGEVALKVFHAPDRFPTEAKAARAVSHPNVCPVFDFFTFEHPRCGALAALTMKYLRGETLANRLSRGAVAEEEALQIARGIGAGIDALHAEGIVHRDLKPANIMLTTGDDGSLVAVIVDFGVASIAETGGRPSCGPETSLTAIAGSPDYMAPEQFRKAPVTKAADIYAFGLILFELICGRRPFPHEDLLPAAIRRVTEDAPRIRDVAPWAPRSWDDAVGRSLAQEASERPASAREVLMAIEAGPVRGEARCSHKRGRHSRRGCNAE
jgi:serine/threonine-protein kinase